MHFCIFLGTPTSTPGRSPLVLVLAPTRELANQVYGDFQLLAQSLSVYCIYGGVPYWPQGKCIVEPLYECTHMYYFPKRLFTVYM